MSDFDERFKRVSAAVRDFAPALEQSPLALTALHIEREYGPDYSLINREVFELLEAKAAAWDESQRNTDQEREDEKNLIGMLNPKKH